METFLTSVVAFFLSSPYATIRTQASKCFKALLSADAELGRKNKQIASGIAAGLTDSSPPVREATIGMVGEVVLKKPELLSVYYADIVARTRDYSAVVRSQTA